MMLDVEVPQRSFVFVVVVAANAVIADHKN